MAVVQGLEGFEQAVEELEFVKAIARGLSDAQEGSTLSLAEAR